MSPNDANYYSRRAKDERERAKEASRADVAAIHEELARQYEALIEHSGLRLAPLVNESSSSAASKARSSATPDQTA